MCSWLWMLYQPLSIDNFVSIANTIMMVISALSILQSFPTRRIGRDRISFNSVLPAGERRRHWSMFDCSAGIAPDEISFNTVLGSLDKALRHAVTMDSLLTSPLSELWLRAVPRLALSEFHVPLIWLSEFERDPAASPCSAEHARIIEHGRP
ncbi:unnamed protein product [Symbiodinium microadriaticum]|nr:unnamed protein product [Symbiodinium microadriaticum]